MHKKKLVVIGGGAAGFFCAINVARLSPGMEVVLVERSAKLLSKVKVSGGGRCNVTHACFDIAEMAGRYPRGYHFVKKTFHRFFTTDTVNWFAERSVVLKTEKDGRMFPATNSSQTIIDCLMKEAEIYGVSILMKTTVEKIESLPHNNDKPADRKFRIHCSPAKTIEADLICIACGGYPKTAMFDWLKELGHSVEDPVPSLFTFNLPAARGAVPVHPITRLMGLSVDNAKIKITGSRLEQDGPLLITHWGLSGPAVLKLSAWGARELAKLNWEFPVLINWLPDYKAQQLAARFQGLRFEFAVNKIINKNPFGLPQRLWEFFVTQAGISNEKRWADLSSKEQTKLITELQASAFSIKGKTTFKEEFVTAGGIRLNEIDPNTMMSKKMPGIYFAGEIMDVDGITGGYNFQHAWTSGFIAAQAITDFEK